MRHSIIRFGGSLALTAALCATAKAQETSATYLAEHLPAPSDVLELKVGTGYTQGFGNLAPGRGLADVGGAGIGVSADVDYRLNHRWSFGVEGQYQELSAEQNSGSRGFAANLGATYHFEPLLRGDPWVRLGTGYRMLWDNNPTGASGVTVLRHGFELAAAKIGYDVRVSENVALAPVLGADLNVFVWEDPSNGSSHALSTAQVGTFVYAGLQGRFDLGGAKPSTTTVTSVPVSVPAAPPPPVQETRPVTPSIAVSEDIYRDCRLDLDAIDKAPKFDFNRTELLPSDLQVLWRIGECFATGPMKGMEMTLVGRADPRGALKYNDVLGMKRANGVAAYLEWLGVEGDKIDRTSRGKRDAIGYDEPTWAVDRRVDVLLGRH